MKLLYTFVLVLLTYACNSYLTPEETVAKSILACQEGDADTRWELTDKASREKLLKDKTEDEILKRFEYEAFMYKLIKSWETEVIEQSDSKITMKMKYKFYDPHSKKVKDKETDIILHLEEGRWKIEE
ncbi:MAG: hypothetical protein MK132_17890 [Lentisphaerales bacterium]|nr:hypothetical protein [Lentisphaerales bacterium]